jgi:hypothetical protein
MNEASPARDAATAGDFHPYAALTPDVVLDALASVGLYGDGRLMALSSYENRVYQVHAGRTPRRAQHGGRQVLPARALERRRRSWKSTPLPGN